LTEWRKQEETFIQDLKSIISYDDENHIEYMDALSKESQRNLKRYNLDRWINNLKQTVQPLKTIIRPTITAEAITETKLDEDTDTLYLTDGCSRLKPYLTVSEV